MENLEIRFLGDLQRLQPQPGDVYVLSTEQTLDMATCERLRKWLTDTLGSAKVLVLTDGLKLGVMGATPEPPIGLNVSVGPVCTQETAKDTGRQVARGIDRAYRNLAP